MSEGAPVAVDGGPVGGDPPEEPYVSLYRRFRPGRFGELRGQDHVVLAVRSAVRDGHVSHAYLFSGPRGTGKTSTARILARALNCAAPLDGEPCGVCPSCREIARGNSLDVHELDAASNNGVDAMRDLVAHAALSTPGRWKVYIVDEVHMLSNAAANALLKTLEEPPGHVVFVLATTDPQKVPPTIRSRTQHFEFRLLGSETLQGLLRDVRDQADLGLDDGALAVAVRLGRGSARDALSALDQVAATGSADHARPELAAVLEALADDDAGRVLVAVARLHDAGWGAQQLAVELVDELRQGFLAALAPELSAVDGLESARLADQGARLGLPRLVRAMEMLGRALVDMREAPDPRVVLEVTLVRLARPDLDDSAAALGDRLGRLERAVAALGPPPGNDRAPARPVPPPAAPPPAAPPPAAPPVAAPPTAAGGAAATAGPLPPPVPGAPVPTAPVPSAPVPAAAGPMAAGPMAAGPTPSAATDPGARPGIGALRRQRPHSDESGAPAPIPAPAPPGDRHPAPPGAASEPAVREVAPAAAASDVVPPDRDTVVEAWGDHLLRGLPARAKALFGAGRFVSVEGTTATFALPNQAHRDRCEDVRPVVEGTLGTYFGTPMTLALVVDEGDRPGAPGTGALPLTGGSPRPGSAGGRRLPVDPEASDDDEEEDFDPDDPGEPVAAESVAEARVLEAFPGAQEVPE